MAPKPTIAVSEPTTRYRSDFWLAFIPRFGADVIGSAVVAATLIAAYRPELTVVFGVAGAFIGAVVACYGITSRK